MRLYITPGSPYARMARMVVMEKGLEKRVEVIVAQTRKPDSSYYRINPSGRVPYLVRDDGSGLEESAAICDWLDGVDGKPALRDAGWEHRRLEGLARSLVDGLAVWGRELTRPGSEQSPGLIAHETARMRRMTDLWELEIAHDLMRAPLNMAQLTLACGLAMEARNPTLDWRSGHPRLAAWFDAFARRPSFVATAPPRE